MVVQGTVSKYEGVNNALFLRSSEIMLFKGTVKVQYLKVLKGAIPKGARCSTVLYLKVLKSAIPKGAQRCYT